ncbi:unannotated protein [freshwater metagenome]|uniref:Unannotated protein n=1 Tax=freshwater metagenome TaxID=449393 RepID=A0A6J7DLJ8_9ZZZZ
MHQQEQSNQVEQPVALQRWLSLMLIIQISKNSSRQRSMKRTRFAHCVMLALIWILVAKTSSRFNIRTPITQFASAMTLCAPTKVAQSSVLRLAPLAKLSNQLMHVHSFARWLKPLGHVLILEFSMTTQSMTGTPTQRLVASMLPIHALSTCHLTTHHVTWLHLT